jgi:hypothetical protein
VANDAGDDLRPGHDLGVVFSVVMGVALMLTGIGFLVPTIAVLRPDTATQPTPQAD